MGHSPIGSVKIRPNRSSITISEAYKGTSSSVAIVTGPREWAGGSSNIGNRQQKGTARKNTDMNVI